MHPVEAKLKGYLDPAPPAPGEKETNSVVSAGTNESLRTEHAMSVIKCSFFYLSLKFCLVYKFYQILFIFRKDFIW